LDPDWILYPDLVLDLAFRPDRARREPVYRQLEPHLRGLIEARRLTPGERLPASRDLAGTLGLSRNTVSQAYQTLVDESGGRGSRGDRRRRPGIAFGWGGAFALPGSAASDADRHLMLSFARLSPVRIEEGIACLADAIRTAQSALGAAATGSSA
jgi:DNA-binding transcriptional MocR family regulator